MIFWLGLATALGAGLRLVPALTVDFPIGDGGLFYTMIRELWAHQLVIPAFTAYNHAGIPFDYPPLGFVLAAAAHALTGASWLTVLRLLPPVISILTIPAFYLLARALLQSDAAVVAATFVYAVAPQSFEWEIKGGGITRAPGLLFCLLALQQIVLMYRSGRWKHLGPAAVFSALTALSHPEWTWFLALSAAVMLAGLGRTRTAVAQSAALLVAAAAITLPLLIVDVSHHGLTPFLAAFGGSEALLPWYQRIVELTTLGWTAVPAFPLTTALALFGLLACVRRSWWLLPSWLAVVFLLTSRGPTEKIAVPLAILAGLGVQDMILPVLRDAMHRSRGARAVAVALAALAVWQLALTAVAAEAAGGTFLTRPERAGLAWLSHHTPRSSSVLVVSANDWAANYPSEWLPALTGRMSLAETQGYEWLPGRFAAQLRNYDALRRCAYAGASCLDGWMRAHGRPDYVYVPLGSPTLEGPPCCTGLADSLRVSRRYREVFHNGAAAVFLVPKHRTRN